MSRMAWVVSLAIGGLLTALNVLYMLYLRVPAVMSVRPELAEVGFWAGLFSGRGQVYLWYHYPLARAVTAFVLFTVAVRLALATAGGSR